jgi:hypothetical protein
LCTELFEEVNWLIAYFTKLVNIQIAGIYAFFYIDYFVWLTSYYHGGLFLDCIQVLLFYTSYLYVDLKPVVGNMLSAFEYNG